MNRQSRDIQVAQESLSSNRRLYGEKNSAPFIAQIRETHSDRMTCDITTPDGQLIDNIPILTQGGLVDSEPYGEVCLPAVDDYVVVMHASYGSRHKVIVGTILPYLATEFGKDAVNSASKAHTKKLFEADKPNTYKRIYKSGTTIEVSEDGSVIIETPTGQTIHMDEENGKTIINGHLEVLL